MNDKSCWILKKDIKRFDEKDIKFPEFKVSNFLIDSIIKQERVINKTIELLEDRPDKLQRYYFLLILNTVLDDCPI